MNPFSLLRNRASGTAAIKAPALNLTIAGSVAALVVSVLGVWTDSYEKFFGFKPEEHPGVARALAVAIIAAVTLLWVADILGRAIAAIPRERIYGEAPAGWTADIVKPEADDLGYTVAAMQLGPAGTEYLLVKGSSAPVWKAAAQVTIHTGS